MDIILCYDINNSFIWKFEVFGVKKKKMKWLKGKFVYVFIV